MAAICSTYFENRISPPACRALARTDANGCMENGMRRKEKGPEVSLQPFMCSLPKRLKRQGHPPDQF
jgi:hypothetical protein